MKVPRYRPSRRRPTSWRPQSPLAGISISGSPHLARHHRHLPQPHFAIPLTLCYKAPAFTAAELDLPGRRSERPDLADASLPHASTLALPKRWQAACQQHRDGMTLTDLAVGGNEYTAGTGGEIMTDRFQHLIAGATSERLSRRALLKRAAALGLSGTALASFLAACGAAATATAVAPTVQAGATAAATAAAGSGAAPTAAAAATQVATASGGIVATAQAAATN